MDKQKSTAAPSSNWAKLQKALPPKSKEKKSTPEQDSKRKGYTNGKGKSHGNDRPFQPRGQKSRPNGRGVGQYLSRAEFAQSSETSSQPIAGPSTITIPAPANVKEDVIFLPAPADSLLVDELRQMVAGRNVLNESKRAPGSYVAIDCEMVGLGHLGSESALARVSLVNFHGHILLDTFVQPREKVTDWRTWISGVRESDLVGAPEFEEVQAKVAGLVADRILVGHAIDNDLKVLLLSHPRPLIRDTQKCQMLREKAKNKHPGLKKLSEIELGIQIQKASHSSVTDARATMALYRLHKVEWEKQLYRSTEAYRQITKNKGKLAEATSSDKGGKRKRDDDNDGDEAEEEDDQEAQLSLAVSSKKGKKEVPSFTGGGRKGISSGLGVIVRRNGQRVDGQVATGSIGGGSRRAREAANSGGNWWEQAAG